MLNDLVKALSGIVVDLDCYLGDVSTKDFRKDIELYVALKIKEAGRTDSQRLKAEMGVANG
jgi:hypothetical protein